MDRNNIYDYHELLKVDGGAIILTVNRDPEKVKAQDEDSGGQPSFISREAFDALGEQFLAWLWSRFIRHDESVTDLAVEVRVRFDGKEPEGGTIHMPFRPEPIIDGSHRG